MEVVVLKKLQSSSPHICGLLGCGRTDKINYIVMTLLGPNLSELRKQQPKLRFSLSTTLRVGVQVIAAVRAMHNCGFLHRDIKPSNFAIGASSVTKQTCFMLDFGLARQFKTSTGELRPPRPVAGFRGTVRYASINAHQSKDLGRHDDLWSVFYLLVELANGELPWKKIRDKEKAGKFKMNFDHKKLLKHLPTEFFDFLDHLKSLDYFQEPNYIMLSTLLQNAIRYLGINRSDPFDWEQDPSIQSLTTISAGSAPALQTNNKAHKGKEEIDGGEDARTNLSIDDECLSPNMMKKGGDDRKGHFAHCEEERHLPQGTGTCSAEVQCKRPRGSGAPKQLHQRCAMPPSPLLQATHLLQNNSGSAHADSLDRFFDMRVGDGGSRSHSQSCKSSSRNSCKRTSNLDNMKAKSPSEDKIEISSAKHKSQQSSRSKSKSQTSSSGCHSMHKEAAKEDNQNHSGIPLAAESVNNRETEEALQDKRSDKHSSSDQSHNSELRYSSFKVGRSVASTLIHPDTAPAPQLGYTIVDPTPSPHPLGATVGAVQVRPDTDILTSAGHGVERSALGGTGEDGLSTDVKMTTTRLLGVQLGRNSTVERTFKIDEGEMGEERGRQAEMMRGRGVKAVAEDKDVHSSLKEPSSASESSGVQHRLFACGIQNGCEQVNDAEVLPLQTIPPARSHSPGPPPLDFSDGRLQTMWGQDSTQPMSLTHNLILSHNTLSQRGKISDPLVILPHPPDNPPPKHYKLLAARRRRFRRPGKT